MTHPRKPSLSLVAILLAVAAQRASADEVDYVKDVKPVLAAKCYACHGALQQKSELRVDTVAAMLEGGNKGPAIVAGDSKRSPIVDHVLGANGLRRMPPPSDGEAMSERQVALLKRWIDEGAKRPKDDKPEADPRDHWAFRAPVRPDVPKGVHPIDHLVAAGLKKHGLTAQKPADRRVLLRRVYLDLIGLPPTLEEQEAFLKDESPQAYEKVVDRLLASPHYGERWARHWMDVWRYSDWYGLGAEVRNSHKHVWHWRDWIVESLNADKGYDQMVREMLAADELYPTDLDRLRATGYLVRHYFLFNRTTWLDETIEHTSKAFMGLTFNCGKCHDHKFDPISHVDYYRFRAFFEPYQVRHEMAPGESNFDKNGIPRAYDCKLTEPTYVHVRGDDRNPIKTKAIAPGLPKALTWGELSIKEIQLPPEAHTPSTRPHVLKTAMQGAQRDMDEARKALEAAKQLPASDENKAKIVLAEKSLAAAEAHAAFVNARADADRVKSTDPKQFADLAKTAAKLEKQIAVAKAEVDLAKAELVVVQAKAPTAAQAQKSRAVAEANLAKARKLLENPGDTYSPIRGARKAKENNLEKEDSLNKPFPTTSTGRRTALAQWLTDKRNPLTARVAANHIWGRHLGRPIVTSVFDFGRKGDAPSNQELLDFLAVELVDHNWSMKHLHRLIVTSAAYRASSSNVDAADNFAKDPDNVRNWRMNAVRMEAQNLRDCLLHLSGELDLKLGGPSITPTAESKRRSIYLFHSQNSRDRFLGNFDDASPRECYRRSESIIPQQALALSNGKLALTSAQKIADRIHSKLGNSSDADFVRAAFALVLANEPTPEELAECQSAMTEFRKIANGSNADVRARTNLIQALLNHNDFVTVR